MQKKKSKFGKYDKSKLGRNQKVSMGFGTIFVSLYFLFLLFVIYVFIFGNNKCNRNTFVGSIYRYFTIKLPQKMNICFRRIFHLKPPGPDDSEQCVGKGGPCRYFIFIFFVILYACLVLDYFICTYPFLRVIYHHLTLNVILSFVLPAIPWIIVVILQFVDPGVITEKNVEGYLKKYPYDHVIYKEKMCPTDHIPVVPRSRYCGYTHRRIAKYDHYCPWVLQSIGEKTHKWFILFLISCTAASIYYCIGDLLVIAIHVMVASKKIKWTKNRTANLLIYMVIIFKLQKWNAAAVIIFVVLILTLMFFIGQQLYYISINKTQIELDKYEEETEKRLAKGIKKPIPNFYDKGIVENWREFLHPEPVEDSPHPWKPNNFWKKIIKEEEMAAKKKEKLEAKKNENEEENENKEKTE